MTPPKKLSEVAAWLRAHPALPRKDLSVLAPRTEQKADEKAAAIRALGMIGGKQALNVLAGYRPRLADGGGAWHQGQFGDTFNHAVAKEIARAWLRFDRRTFAATMFSRLERLWFWNAGPLAEIDGLGAAEGLRDFRAVVLPSCDLAPLAECAMLTRLELNVVGRTGGLEPLSRISELKHLQLANGFSLTQSAVDALIEADGVEVLDLSGVATDIDLTTVLSLPKLLRLKLGAGERRADARTVEALRRVLDRGCEVALYDHEGWPREAAKQLPGITCVCVGGRIALTRDSARREPLEHQLRMDSFLEIL